MTEEFPFPFGYWSGKNAQAPPPGPFNSDHLTWICEEAMIPTSRISDFLLGEENRPLTSCSFTNRKVDDPEMISGKSSRRYWCCFGPKDLREKVLQQLPVSTVKKGKGSRPWRASRSLGTSQHRGCQSHFHIYQFKVRLDVVIVKWAKRAHVDAKGRVCHGTQDPTASLGNAMTAPRISEKCREVVERLLRTGVQPVDIMLEHQKMLKALRDSPEETVWPRDAQLTLKDVLNIQLKLQKVLHNYHSNDAVAVEMWIEQNRENVIFHQRSCEAEKRPFILAVASTWMMESLAKLGHGNAVSLDATFGSNSYGYDLFTVLCFDGFQNGIPCCWAITGRHEARDLELILSHVKEKASAIRRDTLKADGEWCPSCIIVDDSKEEQAAISSIVTRAVYNMKRFRVLEVEDLRVTTNEHCLFCLLYSRVFPDMAILLCLWHVRRSWIKQLHAKVSNPLVKADMNRALGAIMYATEGSRELSEQFMEEFQHETKFMDYYVAHWHSRLDKWAKEFRGFRHNNQNTNGSIERWHRTLKVHLRASRKGKTNRRVSWLLHILFDVIENHYWGLATLKQQGRIRNSIMHKLVEKAIENAREIPDEQVSLHVIEGRKCGFVASQEKPDQIHEVTNYECELACCTCSQGAQGNVCKHQIKCLLLSGFSELAIVQRLGTYYSTCAGGLDMLTGAHTVDPDSERPDDVVECPSSPPDGAMLNKISPSTITEEEAFDVIRSIWRLVGTSATREAHAATIIRDAHERMKDIAARDSVLETDLNLEPFETLPGTDNSLKRKPDFIERFMTKRVSKSVNRKQKSHDLPENVVMEDFPQRRAKTDSMQSTLDKAALQSIHLNLLPSQYRQENVTVASKPKRRKK